MAWSIKCCWKARSYGPVLFVLVVFGVVLLFDNGFELFFAGDRDPLFRRREDDWLELISPRVSTGIPYCSIVSG